MTPKFFKRYAPAHTCADPRNSCIAADDPDQNICFEALTSDEYLYSPEAWA